MKSGHCGFPLFHVVHMLWDFLTAVDRSLKPKTARLYELQLALFETRQAPQERRPKLRVGGTEDNTKNVARLR